MTDHFWLSDVQWSAIEASLPKVSRGPRRVDDRRVISGMIYQLREGCRWRALPEVYGPYTTVFNRYNRWKKRGLWQAILIAIGEGGEPSDTVVARSGSTKVRRSAKGKQSKSSKAPAKETDSTTIS